MTNSVGDGHCERAHEQMMRTSVQRYCSCVVTHRTLQGSGLGGFAVLPCNIGRPVGSGSETGQRHRRPQPTAQSQEEKQRSRAPKKRNGAPRYAARRRPTAIQRCTARGRRNPPQQRIPPHGATRAERGSVVNDARTRPTTLAFAARGPLATRHTARRKLGTSGVLLVSFEGNKRRSERRSENAAPIRGRHVRVVLFCGDASDHARRCFFAPVPSTSECQRRPFGRWGEEGIAAWRRRRAVQAISNKQQRRRGGGN